MRIGTWNLAGGWSDAHRDLLLGLDCDVLLLTEVDDRLELADYSIHRTTARFAPKRTWAAVATRAPMATRPDPHPATALVTSGGWTFASSVLPWRDCGANPWGAGGHADRTVAVLDVLTPELRTDRLIWGGDWNHQLSGREYAGSKAGRTRVLTAMAELGLTVPTALLPHRISGLLSIDHIAVPADSSTSSEQISALKLSDHDAYAVELQAHIGQ